MCAAIKAKGIIPFFANTIKGYSIEELTAPQFWFDADENEDELGPWDWKIDCIQTGDIQRVYRGENLTYVGWQVSTFCTPEDYFEEAVLPDCTSEESRQRLLEHLVEITGEADLKKLERILL